MRNARWWEHSLDPDAPVFPSVPVKVRKFVFWKIVFPITNRLLDLVEIFFRFIFWLISVKDEPRRVATEDPQAYCAARLQADHADTTGHKGARLKWLLFAIFVILITGLAVYFLTGGLN